MGYAHTVGGVTWRFADLRELLARATPLRSGDVLAGLAAGSAEERVAARMALAELPLSTFLSEAVVPYEADEVTRLIADSHDDAAFEPVAHLTVGDFRNWLLSEATGAEALAGVAPGLTPEMAAAVSKLMRNQDLVLVARKCRVVTRFRDTIGLPGPALGAPAAEPPDRRPAGHRRRDARRAALRLRRRGHRRQPRHRLGGLA